MNLELRMAKGGMQETEDGSGPLAGHLKRGRFSRWALWPAAVEKTNPIRRAPNSEQGHFTKYILQNKAN